MSSFWSKAAAGVRSSEIDDGAGGLPPPRRSIRRDPPQPAALPDLTDDVLRLRIGEELEYARRILTVMGEELVGDPAIVARHPASLQSIDIVGQTLSHLAAVVRARDSAAAVERIGMVELKARLTRTSVG